MLTKMQRRNEEVDLELEEFESLRVGENNLESLISPRLQQTEKSN